jgi:hypothetical protein
MASSFPEDEDAPTRPIKNGGTLMRFDPNGRLIDHDDISFYDLPFSKRPGIYDQASISSNNSTTFHSSNLLIIGYFITLLSAVGISDLEIVKAY